jgi:hypothetical protein
MFDPEKEQYYLRLAVEQPDFLCSDAPAEVLEDCASEAEPSKFHEEYFAVGHAEWLARKHGRRINPPKAVMDQAILVLWYRATLLNTARILGVTSEHAEQQFFSDEGLY